MRFLTALTLTLGLALAIVPAAAHEKKKHDDKAAKAEPAAASTGHDHSKHQHGESGHGDDHHGMMAAGKPGKAEDATRTVEITMKEAGDGAMVFEPADLSFKKDETVRFMIVNAGKLDHEFVLDDHHGVMEHKALMERFPEMEHDDPNSVRLEPGEKGEIVWTFAKDGGFEYACLIPGHHDAGMKGSIAVVNN